ncbi:AAT family amino acid transporter [Chromobacterium alkanivorans]|uniref:amino acid permease n=1 Tax=Chromobacterium TaxID=535 RepID=UPI0006538108|nr:MULTISPECIES: amino acid permease [Chromobacterium]KMN76735.1 D-alanine/D-serine/glycine permease [Chromobacterium sp. LK11]MBN3004591.1 amino acid permease [Chromobacterium alkanivorans]MCS3804981.1 AAT family amino acid transporter [Chromobacterium alkanivorans]MCS3819456.1 AAT family amino acid transporter [Chromobacterium alkanivorans]MCS3873968.1 AAT family amino acid transporter [Chromobacterium alkanivorans]
MQPAQDTLHRGLEERHINLMALGATIGVGLFLGSATAIKMAGPAIMLAYALGGFAIFLIMRALGEMAIHNPVAGSFSRYALDYLGPLAGYLTGWNYWFLWLVTCMAEITAVGVYMGIWFPDVPAWYWALAALVAMGGVNFIAVKAYGEFEFWFALIKIVTIVLMIIGGLGMIVFGLGHGGVATGISNLWSHGGFMPNGFSGVLMSLQMVMFAYLGVEMLGLTAGEAKNPKKALARAVDSVFWRILIFYIGALFVILAIYPWNELGTRGSPFVLTFEQLGIPAAAGIINFVVLTAALSSCNSGIFSTGRMLYNLAQQQQALPVFAKVSRHGVPVFALLMSVFALLVGVLLNYLAPKEVFTWLTAISTFGAIWTWVIILLAQLRFRRTLSREQLAELAYKMPFWPYGSYIAMGFLILVVGLMAYFPDTRIALIVGPGWLAFLVVAYYLLGYNKRSAEEVARLAQNAR